MNRSALVEVGTLLRVLKDFDLLHLARLLGIFDVIRDLEVEAARHDSLHLREHLRLEYAVHQRICFLLGADSEREPIILTRGDRDVFNRAQWESLLDRDLRLTVH